jgi:NTP pyrophosphatase (non-canonical NTP hydrolase)
MDFNEYQQLATRTAGFTGKLAEVELLYLGLGVTSEAGEVADKIKKLMRNHDGVLSEETRDGLKYELGDVLWYLSQIARVLDIPFSEIAAANVEKLADRAARNVIKSTGDNR